ncbi:4242_t:CDS:1 [Funneliformis geosporum]|uniref:4242_t:CDS:1 n=1 Tax=Funneliformis geosporum TaxID=1117311 RepID=A0A9W4WQU2_9GLOM|nr:4242_t:CDS:1 [Funneliformis geosporum]
MRKTIIRNANNGNMRDYLSKGSNSILNDSNISKLDINDILNFPGKLKTSVIEIKINTSIALNQATESSTEFINELMIFLINQLTRRLIELIESIWLYKLFHYYNASNKEK